MKRRHPQAPDTSIIRGYFAKRNNRAEPSPVITTEERLPAVSTAVASAVQLAPMLVVDWSLYPD